MELAADQELPGDVGVDARLERRCVNARLGEGLGELGRRHMQPLAHIGVVLLHVLVRDLDLIATADLQLELLVDQILDDFRHVPAACDWIAT